MIWYYDVFMEQTIQIFNYDQHEVSKVYTVVVVPLMLPQIYYKCLIF